MRKTQMWWGEQPPKPVNEELNKIRHRTRMRVKRMSDRHAIMTHDYERWCKWSMKLLRDYSDEYEATHDPTLFDEFESVVDYWSDEYPYRDYEGKSSVVKRMGYCIRCQRPMMQIHHVFGGPRRKLADEDGFVIPLCDECHRMIHESKNFSDAWKTVCQKHFETYMGTHEEWMERYGKNYIDTPLKRKLLRREQRQYEKEQNATHNI